MAKKKRSPSLGDYIDVARLFRDHGITTKKKKDAIRRNNKEKN